MKALRKTLSLFILFTFIIQAGGISQAFASGFFAPQSAPNLMTNPAIYAPVNQAVIKQTLVLPQTRNSAIGYDYDSRLTGAANGTTTAGYGYNSFGDRISKTVNGITTDYLYDGDSLIAEYDSTGALQKKYVYSDAIDEPALMIAGTDKYYYHADGLGSITEVTNAAGNTLEKYKYGVYGSVSITDANDQPLAQSSIGNRYLFTGREFDSETGLYHYRARAYSPSLGRFLQTDPLRLDDENPYAYCWNDPVNYIDPYGLQAVYPNVVTNPIWRPIGTDVLGGRDWQPIGTDVIRPDISLPTDPDVIGPKIPLPGENAPINTKRECQLQGQQSVQSPIGINFSKNNNNEKKKEDKKKRRKSKKKEEQEKKTRKETIKEHWRRYRNPRDSYEKNDKKNEIRELIRRYRERFGRE